VTTDELWGLEFSVGASLSPVSFGDAGGGQAWWEIPWEEVLETVGERRRVKWGCGM
jgi:hypothetical protein